MKFQVGRMIIEPTIDGKIDFTIYEEPQGTEVASDEFDRDEVHQIIDALICFLEDIAAEQ